jgi:hypothetical protein
MLPGVCTIRRKLRPNKPPKSRQECAPWRAGQHPQGITLVNGYRRRDVSNQFGRASAPMMPQAGAHSERAERRHRHVVRPRVGGQHRLIVTLPAPHVERPYALLTGI